MLMLAHRSVSPCFRFLFRNACVSTYDVRQSKPFESLLALESISHDIEKLQKHLLRRQNHSFL